MFCSVWAGTADEQDQREHKGRRWGVRERKRRQGSVGVVVVEERAV